MNNRALRVALVVFLALASFACGGGRLIPFTHELRTEHNLADADLKNLQYYVSNRITLRREITADKQQITGSHKLLLVSGRSIEEVVVEKETPGVCVAVSGRTMSVSFEPGSSMLFSVGADPAQGPPSLSFAQPPDPFPGNSPERPQEPPAEDGLIGPYMLALDSSGHVRYQNGLFAAVEDSARAHLMISAESLEQVVQSRKVLPGMRLPDH